MRAAKLWLIALCLCCGCAALGMNAPSIPIPRMRLSWQLPQIQRASLSNGMQVYVIVDPYSPIVSVRLALRAGSGADTPGLARLAYQALLLGSASHQVDVELDALGAAPRLQVGVDGADIALSAQSATLPQVVALLAEAAVRPRLSEEDVARLQRRTLALISAASMDTVGLALLMREIYGAAHAFGAPPLGTMASVSALRREDVARFHHRFVGPGNAALVLVGRVTLAEAVMLAQRSFGGWTAPAQGVPVPALPPVLPRDHVVLVPAPGQPQTLILLGKAMVPVGHPDELPLRFVDRVPAAMVSFRMYQYHDRLDWVSGGVSAHRGAGHMINATWVRADQTAAMLREILHQYGEMRDRLNPTPAAIYEARARAALALMGSFTSLDHSAGSVARLFLLGLSTGEYERRFKALLEVQAGELRPIARQYLDPDTLQIVLVGDPMLLQKQLTSMRLGRLVTAYGL